MIRPIAGSPPPPPSTRPRPATSAPPEPADRAELSGLSGPSLRGATRESYLSALVGWSAGLVAPLFGFLGQARTEKLEPPPERFRAGSRELSGALTSGANPPATTLEEEPVRTYALTRTGQLAQVDFGGLLEGTRPRRGPALKARTITRSQLDSELKKAHESRQRKLEHLERSRPAPTAVPKDASLNPQAFSMFARPGAELDLGYVEQMASLGQVEGFTVILETPPGSQKEMREILRERGIANAHVLPTRGSGETWTEDYGEMNLAGGAGLPSFIDSSLSDEAVTQGRHQRFPGEHRWWKPSTWLAPDPGNFDQLGAVSGGDYQRSLAGAALARGLEIRENFSHIEGGNLLTGTMPDGSGYALVGRDSLAVTRAVLENDLGRPVEESETLLAIAKDLGMEPEHVHPIEQPGAFHLDMRMMLAAPGQAILNDAREAAALQEKWLLADHKGAEPVVTGPLSAARHFGWKLRGRALESQIKSLRAEGERRAVYEDRTLKDLEAAGLQVGRIPGVYVEPSSVGTDAANLVNGRHGVNDRGERFFIGLGAEQRAEAVVAERLMQELPTGISRVHFLDRELTPQTLDLSGGIKCRTKPEGELHLEASALPELRLI